MRPIGRTAFTLFMFTAFALLIALLVVLPQRLAFRGAEQYTFFTGKTSSDCRIVTTDCKDAPLIRLTLDNICGESATYGNLDIDKFLQSVNGEVLFTETLSDSTNYYCRADLPYSVALYGQTVNLHICVKESGVTVASPIIFGGY